MVVLPYDLVVKEVFSENIKLVTDFSKKTGDYPSLSATDIKIIALTYQLELEKVGNDHLNTEPVIQKVTVATNSSVPDVNPNVTGFYVPGKTKKIQSVPLEETIVSSKTTGEVIETNSLESMREHEDHILDNTGRNNDSEDFHDESGDDDSNSEEDDDEAGWITPSNVNLAKKRVNSELMEDKHVKVACMTTDFAMQNVLKQMNLNVAALDGRLIKQLRTYILRCYSCFKTTSIMTKKFCPACGNDTLKKVAVSLDENGKMVIHINTKRPLTARGKKFSLPTIKGGKHPNNPILVDDQPMPDNKPTRLARTKNNPLDDDYTAGKLVKYLYLNSKLCNLALYQSTLLNSDFSVTCIF